MTTQTAWLRSHPRISEFVGQNAGILQGDFHSRAIYKSNLAGSRTYLSENSTPAAGQHHIRGLARH